MQYLKGDFKFLLVLTLFLIFFGCSSKQDQKNQEIQLLSNSLLDKADAFNTFLSDAKKAPFTTNYDSLLKIQQKLDSSFNTLKHSFESANDILKQKDLQKHQTEVEKISVKLNSSKKTLNLIQSFKRLKIKIIQLEKDIAKYDSLSRYVAIRHFTRNVDSLILLQSKIFQLDLECKTLLNSLNDGTNLVFRTNLTDKWNLAHAKFQNLFDQLLINFSKSVLFLITKEDERALKLIDWNNIVIDADKFGQSFQKTPPKDRPRYIVEVLQTTSGMFNFLFNTSKHSITNVRNWKVEFKTYNTAKISAKTFAKESLSFHILIFKNKILLTLLKTC